MGAAIVATLLLAGGLYAGVTGARRLARGLGQACSLDVVRGLRRLVIALATAAVAGGVLAGQAGFVVLGAVFLGEELYETGVLALILRSSAADSA
jgi:hypothetical protein